MTLLPRRLGTAAGAAPQAYDSVRRGARSATSTSPPAADARAAPAATQRGTEAGDDGRVGEAARAAVLPAPGRPPRRRLRRRLLRAAARRRSDTSSLVRAPAAADRRRRRARDRAHSRPARSRARCRGRVRRLEEGAERVAARRLLARASRVGRATTSSASSRRTLDDMRRQLARARLARASTSSPPPRTSCARRSSRSAASSSCCRTRTSTRRRATASWRRSASRSTRLRQARHRPARPLAAGGRLARAAPRAHRPRRAGARRRRRVRARAAAARLRGSSCALPAAAVDADCDPERVAQVLRILIDNALTPHPAGHRHGRQRRSAATAASASASATSDRASTARCCPHIFEPFFTSDDAQGSGLGLAIAHELAERMDGALVVESQPGRTTFTLELPADELAPAARPAPPSLALAAGCGGAAGCGAAARRAPRPPRPRARPPSSARRASRSSSSSRRGRQAGGVRPAGIYSREAPGVVTVISTGLQGGPGGGSESGLGSGFVISGDGEIATNAHVVTSGEGGAIKQAELGLRALPRRQPGPREDRRLRPVRRRRAAEGRPQGPDAAPAAARLHEGRARSARPVAAIGSPFGEEQSLSVGVVSATDRSIQSLTGFATAGAIQTDAAINHGNSGGPLLDADGRRARHQLADPHRERRRQRASASPSRSTSSSRSLAQLRDERQGPLRLPRRVQPRRSTRSSRSASASRSPRASGCRTSPPGGPAAQAGLRAGSEARALPGASAGPRAATSSSALDGHRGQQGRRPLRARCSPTARATRSRSRSTAAASGASVHVKLGERPLNVPRQG